MITRMRYLILLLWLISGFVAAQNETPAGKQALKDVCTKSLGQWFGEEGGFWSCCWGSWGCLQCEPNGNCDMYCQSEDCRAANDPTSTKTPQEEQVRVKGLTPDSMQEPVVPKNPTPFVKVPLMKSGNIKQTM